MSHSANNKPFSKKLSGLIFPVTLALAAIIIWLLLAVHCHDLLLRIESRSLFLSMDLFFRQWLAKAGGMAIYAGCFLTQFLQFPYIGALIAVLLWSAVTVLTRKAFHLDGAMTALAFIPSALLIAANMDTGYMLYEYRTIGWFFTPTVGYLATVSSICLADRIGTSGKKTVFAVIWTVLGYPLFGFYALLGSLAMTVRTATSGESGRLVRSLTILVLAIAAPLLWSGFVFDTGRVDYSFFAGLPKLFNVSRFIILWLPFMMLALFTLLMSVQWNVFAKSGFRLPALFSGNSIGGYSILLAVSVILVWAFWYKEPQYLTELRMEAALERHDWSEAVRIFRQDSEKFQNHNDKVYEKRTAELGSATGSVRDEIVSKYKYRFHMPTRVMVLYRNLALLKLGTAGSQAFSYDDGDYVPRTPYLTTISIQSAKLLYYQYGLVNFCYRWCIEDAVEYGWNVEVLKYAIRSTLIAQDWNIAEKYITQLEHAPFHRKWATEQRRYLHHPELLAESEEYRDILPILCRSVQNTNDLAVTEQFLSRQFSMYSFRNATPQGCDIAMLWALSSQNTQYFWEQLTSWIATHPSEPLPRHYQEAAYMYGQLEKNIDTDIFGISPEVKASYEKFCKFVSQHPVHNLDEMSYIYKKNFGSTYYYFYYFVRDLHTH